MVSTNKKKIACALIIQHNQCVYVPFSEGLLDTSAVTWMFGLSSILSGLGNMIMDMHLSRSIQEGLMSDCGN